MSFLAATRRAIRPSFASSCRALATEATAPLAGAPEAQAAPVASSSAPAPSLLDSLPFDADATVGDAFVHVPLHTFYSNPLASPIDPPTERMVVPLPAPLFNTPARPSLLHKIVTAHLSSLRAGTASTKNRAEVAFSGKKMRPQKGTGRARLGDRGSPMLKGGGRAFGPRPTGPDGWQRKINRKEEQLGLRVSLSEKWRAGNLVVVDKLGLDEPRTRVLSQKLASRGWTDALFVTAVEGDVKSRAAFELAVGNIPDVALVTDVKDLTVWDIVKRRNVILELEAVDEVIERCDPNGPFVDDYEDFGLEEEIDFDALAEAEAEMEALTDAAVAAEAQAQPAEARV
ncbi:54S ribosomal protein yml6, mitochondrial [Rhodotorula kratochvilovae]